MTTFLTILVLVSITVAIWQMVKIFDLSRKPADDSEIATDQDNKVNGYMLLGFLIFIYLITIISFVLWGDLPLLSDAASEHGSDVIRCLFYRWSLFSLFKQLPSFYFTILPLFIEVKKGKRLSSLQTMINWSSSGPSFQ